MVIDLISRFSFV